MAELSSARKLVVEVWEAKNLMPKDGQGTASAYAIADFDGQRRRTKTHMRDLNPRWEERLEFCVVDPDSDTLEINLYNDNKSAKRSTFLGRVKIAPSAFDSALPSDDLVFYPLEKRSVFSQVKGEIALRLYFLDQAPPQPQPQPEPEPPKKKTEELADDKNDEAQKPAEDPKPDPPPSDKAEPPAVEADKPAEPEAKPTATPEGQKESPAAEKKEKNKSDQEQALELRSAASERAGRQGSACDLVDRMPFLYVRVVKAKLAADGPAIAKLVIGTHSVQTRPHPGGSGNNKDWDQVFAFDKDGLNSTSLEVSVWTEAVEEKKEGEQVVAPATPESCLGTVSFDLGEVPPDSPLAPQWYTLESEQTPGNDVMLSVWIGTQADEAFQEAWQSDSGGLITETRAKVYLSPKLWYLRLTVIQTQDLQLGSAAASDKALTAQQPEIYVKAQLGAQLFKTSRAVIGSAWNEDLMFVAAEPFEPFLVVTVEDVTHGASVGHVKLHVPTMERRTDDRAEPKSRWFNLSGGDGGNAYAGRIHVLACLEGGYHVLDEVAHLTSDVRAAAKQLAKPPIGLLEVGIRGAANLLPVKTKDGTRGTTDAYVVAKYGPKWVRTRTILDRFNPRWNEHYTWDVYDPCTVLTVGVFDNGRYKSSSGKDLRLGKVRIRLSTLDTNRVYVSSYPLVVLLPGGAKRMGEVEIAVRFTCPSWLTLVQAYASPILPRMHYVRPLAPAQQDVLRHTAMRIVTARLARSEPALGQEVVQYLLDSDTHVWSMRRSKASWYRAAACLSRVAALARRLEEVRAWAHPPTTVLAHAAVAAAVAFPGLVLPAAFAYAFVAVAVRFRHRRGAPAGVCVRLSQVEAVGPDELDEEFDGLPSVRAAEAVRARYDRLRALAGRAQTLLADVAAQGERVEALFNWRDPRATAIFVVFLLVASLVLYAVPFKVFVLGAGFCYLRHPRFRDDMPSVPMNFFRRLPSLSDQVM